MQSGINALSMEALKTDAFFSIVAQIKKEKKNKTKANEDDGGKLFQLKLF